MASLPQQQQAKVTDFFATRRSSSRNLTSSASKQQSSTRKLANSTLSSSSTTTSQSQSSASKTKRTTRTKKNVKDDKIICSDLDVDSSHQILSSPSKRGLSSRTKDSASASTTRTKSCSASKRSKINTKKSSADSGVKIEFGPKLNRHDLFNSKATNSKTEQTVISKPLSATSNSLSSSSSILPKSVTLLKADEIKEKLKNCKNLAKLKEQLSSINGCAEKLKKFKEIKVTLSPVKPSYSNLGSPRKIYSPEKFSVSGLTLLPSPLRATPSKLQSSISSPSRTPKLYSPYLADSKAVQSAVKKLQFDRISSCSRRLFSDSSAAGANINNKESTEKDSSVPAYKRFNYLTNSDSSSATTNTTDADPDSCLQIPMKYKKLADTFKRIDYFAWVSYKRQEMCTFDKLKYSIEKTTHKTFNLNTLLKILSVHGTDQNPWFKLSYAIMTGSRQLVIAPIYKDKVKSVNSVSNLLEREKEFYSCMLKITKAEHRKFMSEMKLSLSEVTPIYRWHPMFKLDSIPDIVPNMNLLPKTVTLSTPNPNSILNYCVVREDPTKLPELSDIKKEEKIEETKNDVPETKDVTSTLASAKKVKKGALKGISMDLLQKIRAKEAATLASQMSRNPAIDREILMLGRVPEIIRIIHGVFVESKTIKTMSFDEMIKKISESYHSSLCYLQAEKHLQFLLTLDYAKEWIQKIDVKNDQYIKVNRDVPLSELFQFTKERIVQLKSA